MLDFNFRPTASVVICSYTEQRWELLMDVIDSVHAQTLQPKQVIVVVDHNEDLYKRLVAAVQDVTLVESTGLQGLSGARNTGVGLATSEIVAFLDDDAVAAPDWLEKLTALYDDSDVLAVGGKVEPAWEGGRPGHFGPELDWIVGCSHRGMPKVASEVRNVIGANMSFRLQVLQQVGGFNLSLGRQGTKPLGCEETEICIRAAVGSPGSRIVYEPAALVHHHVPVQRGTFRYMLERSWSEGMSKAQVSHIVGHKRALVPSGATCAASCRERYFPHWRPGAAVPTPMVCAGQAPAWPFWQPRPQDISADAGSPTAPDRCCPAQLRYPLAALPGGKPRSSHRLRARNSLGEGGSRQDVTMENTDQLPWVKNYQPGVPAQIELPTESLVDMLERSVAEAGDGSRTGVLRPPHQLRRTRRAGRPGGRGPAPPGRPRRRQGSPDPAELPAARRRLLRGTAPRRRRRRT